MKKLRLGVIGVGYLGELHAQKYAAMKDVDLVGVVDQDFARAQEVARRYNTTAYSSHTKLLAPVWQFPHCLTSRSDMKC